MSTQDRETDDLVRRAATGDRSAVRHLMQRYRARLCRMIGVRMDPRLAARVDPSDVVQDALLEASDRLTAYAQQPKVPFYLWLRQIAWDRLVDLHRRHIRAQKRSVRREEIPPGLSAGSAGALAARFFAAGESPSEQCVQREMQARVLAALEILPSADREVLVLRHLEQLRIDEIAAILQIDVGAVKMRQLRALERLRAALGDR